MPEKKTLNKTEFLIDYEKRTAKVLNPIDPDNLINEHIFPQSGEACLSIISDSVHVDPKKEFIKQLEIWSHKHMIYREYGIWYNGLSHNLTQAAKEVLYKKLNTNEISIKRLIKDKDFFNLSVQLLGEMKISQVRALQVLKDFLDV